MIYKVSEIESDRLRASMPKINGGREGAIAKTLFKIRPKNVYPRSSILNNGNVWIHIPLHYSFCFVDGRDVFLRTRASYRWISLSIGRTGSIRSVFACINRAFPYYALWEMRNVEQSTYILASFGETCVIGSDEMSTSIAHRQDRMRLTAQCIQEMSKRGNEKVNS